jgi:hypothetical protein
MSDFFGPIQKLRAKANAIFTGRKSFDMSESIDYVGGALTALEWEHAKIHAGHTAMTSEIVTLTGATPGYRLFRVGEKYIHFKEAEFVSEKTGLIVEISEAPTLSDPGTLSDLKRYHNRLRNEDDDIEIYTNPTVTAQGTILETFYIPGGETPGGNFIGGSGSTSWEFMFKQNTDYLIKGYRPDGTGDCQVLVKYRWYIGGKLF